MRVPSLTKRETQQDEPENRVAAGEGVLRVGDRGRAAAKTAFGTGISPEEELAVLCERNGCAR
jgi:hypothetical protein